MPDLPVFDGCQVVEKLRSGAVADLYHAVQQPLGRQVLVKALSASILPSSPFAATLEREARVLADLHHSNILHVIDFVRRDDRMWLVLEYVDGWTLDEVVRESGKIAPLSAAAIALEVARALEHAHRHGVVHRDVQPKNVLISRRGDVKLTNFAVAVDERLPTAPELLDGNTAFGGPLYMSPEQILGEAADPRSDVFSLGVVLYEMLSGKRPFDAPDERTVAQHIRHDAPAPLGRAVTGVPPTLERIVIRCLEKMQSDRYGSVEELVLALERWLGESGVTSTRRQIASGLVAAGLMEEAPRSMADSSVIGLEREGPSLALAIKGLLLCLSLVVVGGGLIQFFVWKSEGQGAARRGAPGLELAPARPAYLRVVADPWADVIVDGKRVDTTPFARAIPLMAGTHYVRLEHPNAPTERRTVNMVPGETVLLDVKMRLENQRVDAGAGAEQEPDASATP
jgi:eukaryotic-like serine/threonine-protein kinase